MEQFECKVCGYVYAPQKGDAESGIAPGTDFSSLPDGWKCPICDSGKKYFTQELTQK